MRKILKHILFLLNLVIAVSLLGAYLGTHISPAHFWPLAFLGLIYPYLLVANILFVLYWVIKWDKRVFISLFIILLGVNHIRQTIPVFHRKEKKQANTEYHLKVLSYNVRAFNLYDWLNDPNTNKGIFNFIRSEHPDILCLQEFYSGRENHISPLEYMKVFGENPYKHIEYGSKEKNYGHGIATFSRYPILKKGSIPFANSRNKCIYTDIQINNDTIRVYNTHLQSVRFQKANYDVLDSLDLRKNVPEMNEIRDISTRLKNAYIKRSLQAELISAHIANSPHPVIVCGDFNDTPVSYTYRKMSRNLNDAWLHAGKGSGNTYRGKLSFRIDYILYSPVFNAVEFEKVEANLSDHYPIITLLGK